MTFIDKLVEYNIFVDMVISCDFPSDYLYKNFLWFLRLSCKSKKLCCFLTSLKLIPQLGHSFFVTFFEFHVSSSMRLIKVECSVGVGYEFCA